MITDECMVRWQAKRAGRRGEVARSQWTRDFLADAKSILSLGPKPACSPRLVIPSNRTWRAFRLITGRWSVIDNFPKIDRLDHRHYGGYRKGRAERDSRGD